MNPIAGSNQQFSHSIGSPAVSLPAGPTGDRRGGASSASMSAATLGSGLAVGAGSNVASMGVMQGEAVSHEYVFKWIEDLGCSETRENSLLELR